MDVYSTTSKPRETYQVEINYSLLWECALGIAAITNTPLLDSLEKPLGYWQEVKESLSQGLRDHLAEIETNNTWKALLQLLHQKDFFTIEEFTAYIQGLPEEELKYICIPYTGELHQILRECAAKQNKDAIQQLQQITQDNPFFPCYIEFISYADTKQLKKHLVNVMSDWYKEMVLPEAEKMEEVLRTDAAAKQQMIEKMHPEEFVEWATSGVTYAPEPSVYKVLLIPQYNYRPWNIVADIEGTKVFYYPVFNASISPADTYMPNQFLVLKHKALGDEVRLRMVKMLFEKSCTLQEITNRLDIGKSTIHHHLKLLRSAQLVGIQDNRYILKQRGLDSLPKELEMYFRQ